MIMKRLTPLYVVCLSACSVFNAGSTRFDSTEYELAVKATVAATRTIHQCEDSLQSPAFATYFRELNTISMVLYEYELDRGKDAHWSAVSPLRTMVTDMVVHTPYSKAFCVAKFSELQSGFRTVAQTLGASGLHVCTSNVSVRFAGYQAQYRIGAITAQELRELGEDILKLETVDIEMCDLATAKLLSSQLSAVSTALAILPL